MPGGQAACGWWCGCGGPPPTPPRPQAVGAWWGCPPPPRPPRPRPDGPPPVPLPDGPAAGPPGGGGPAGRARTTGGGAGVGAVAGAGAGTAGAARAPFRLGRDAASAWASASRAASSASLPDREKERAGLWKVDGGEHQQEGKEKGGVPARPSRPLAPDLSAPAGSDRAQVSGRGCFLSLVLYLIGTHPPALRFSPPPFPSAVGCFTPSTPPASASESAP